MLNIHKMSDRSTIDDIQLVFRTESKNRTLDIMGFNLFNCADIIVGESLGTIKNGVKALLESKKNEFMSIASSLDDSAPIQGQNETSETFKVRCETYYAELVQAIYRHDINHVRRGNSTKFLKTFIFAVSTYLQRSIYILNRNEMGNLSWVFFPSLLTYEQESTLEGIPRYLTMFMETNQWKFFKIDSSDTDASAPQANGLLGVYEATLLDTTISEIPVPDRMYDDLALPDLKQKLTRKLNTGIIHACSEPLLQSHLIDAATSNVFEAHIPDIPRCVTVLISSPDIFTVFCQVLIKRLEKDVIELLVKGFDAFVGKCEYLNKRRVLKGLESAIITRNTVINEAVSSHRISGADIEDRRSKANKVVIVGSSAGAVGGVLAIVGLALSPVTFGVSLGLSIGGAALGVSGGLAGGSARAVEAVKQKMGIKEVNVKSERIEAERDVTVYLAELQQLFSKLVVDGKYVPTESPGIGLRGLQPIGSAFRVAKGGAAVVMASVRVSGAVAAVAASVLGPLSLALDIAFLTEAAYNASNGNRTDASDQLRNMALIIEMKNKIVNSVLRGNCSDAGRVLTIL